MSSFEVNQPILNSPYDEPLNIGILRRGFNLSGGRVAGKRGILP
jgi:hypothetical protein